MKRGGLSRGQKAMTWWGALRYYKPCYVRLLAKEGHSRALTDAEIAIASGIDLNRVREINRMISWDNVTVGEMLRYVTACNFDPMSSIDRARCKKYDYTCKKRNIIPYHYLRKCPKWESEILPVLRVLQAEIPENELKSSAA